MPLGALQLFSLDASCPFCPKARTTSSANLSHMLELNVKMKSKGREEKKGQFSKGQQYRKRVPLNLQGNTYSNLNHWNRIGLLNSYLFIYTQSKLDFIVS